MKKSPLLIICFVVVVAISMMTPAYSSGDEDSKLALYGQYGGPFSLVDHHGKTVTDRDFLGQYVLMFFGYTYCPDVCPTSMQVISDVLDILGEEGKNIQPVFISVDPDRDTPEALGSFIGNIHPRMIALTGPKEQIVPVADDFGVTYFKVFTPPSIGESGDSDDDTDQTANDDYLISHSAAAYLMGTDGKFITIFPFGMPPEIIASGIRSIFSASIKATGKSGS